MAELLHKCLVKATKAEGDQLKYGPNWLLSRRATLKIFEDHLACGDWRIPYDQIQDATLFSIRSLVVIPGFVLRITTDHQTYHFGLNWGRFWTGDLPFPVRWEKAKLKYSRFSLAVRLIFIAALSYTFFQLFSSNSDSDKERETRYQPFLVRRSIKSTL